MVNRALVLVVIVAPLGVACHGPSLHLHNPERHPVFVDGVAIAESRSPTSTTLPFRYYGTTRWDAVPAERGDRPDFDHEPTSQCVHMAPALTGWLFPLDFPVDLIAWLLRGSGDASTTIAVRPAAAAERVQPDSTSADALLERARQARIAR